MLALRFSTNRKSLSGLIKTLNMSWISIQKVWPNHFRLSFVHIAYWPSHVPDDSLRPHTCSTNRKYLACLINTSMSRISIQKILFQSAFKDLCQMAVYLRNHFLQIENIRLINTFNMSRISFLNALTFLILFNYSRTIEVWLMFCDF